MHDKRGLSSIITTVLIILISITAVSAIWIFIKPLVSDSINSSPSYENCIENNIEINTCQSIITELGQQGYNIGYLRTTSESQDVKVNGVKLILELNDGSSVALSADSSILPGESKDSQVLTDKMAKKASVLTLIKIGNKQSSCQSKIISCENKKTEQTETDQNPIIINDSRGNQNQQGYPGCFGIYSDPWGCSRFSTEQECAVNNYWNNQCMWNVYNEQTGICEGIIECGNLITQESCANGCIWLEQPTGCGNSELGEDEGCDDELYWVPQNSNEFQSRNAELFPVNCADHYGFISGAVSCKNDCSGLDFSGCQTCGNDILQDNYGEQCEENIFSHEPACQYFNRNTGLPDDDNCPNYQNGSFNINCYHSGSITCSSACAFDFSACGYCGNDAIDEGEECDGGNIGTDHTGCDWYGNYTSGEIFCNSECMYDSSSCS